MVLYLARCQSKQLSMMIMKLYNKTRACSLDMVKLLETEDYIPQAALFASPPKWNLGHTTWFFEEIILTKYKSNYRVFHPKYSYLFNSSLSSLPALKNGTFLAGTDTVAPVFGFRPSFIRRERSRKLPKPRISVLSPLRSESRMLLNMVLTTISACRFVSVVT